MRSLKIGLGLLLLLAGTLALAGGVSSTARPVVLAPSCAAITHTVTSVGTSPVAVPATGQSGRREIVICVSAENAGAPKVKCMVDPGVGKPAMGLAEPGDVLQIGGLVCTSYTVGTDHPIKCVSDTAATAVVATECVPS